MLCLISPARVSASAIEPEVCSTGAYVVDVYDIDTHGNTFGATLWLWSVCDNPDEEPLTRVDFSNAVEAKESRYLQVQRGSRWWSGVKVIGTFRESYSLQNFPFDEQTLEIEIEDAEVDIENFRYEVDKDNSAVNPELQPGEWTLTDFRVVEDGHQYVTTFGDPELAPGSGATYSRFTVQMDLAHDAPTLFFKVLGPLYISSFVAAGTFLLMLQNAPSAIGRTGLLGTTLFATILSMRAGNEAVGNPGELTMIDGLHVLTMLYILVAIGLTVYAWQIVSRMEGTENNTEDIRLLSRRGMLPWAASYIVVNIVILVWAAHTA